MYTLYIVDDSLSTVFLIFFKIFLIFFKVCFILLKLKRYNAFSHSFNAISFILFLSNLDLIQVLKSKAIQIRRFNVVFITNICHILRRNRKYTLLPCTHRLRCSANCFSKFLLCQIVTCSKFFNCESLELFLSFLFLLSK